MNMCAKPAGYQGDAECLRVEALPSMRTSASLVCIIEAAVSGTYGSLDE